jgi:predicted tellurium resistance membrane protein TerC
MIEALTSPEIWMALATLTFLEIVLGIDNVVFIAVIAGKLPAHQQAAARRLGLGLALGMRIILLFSLVWLTHLEASLFSLFGHDFSWRDIILIGGGLFLLAKGTWEIHENIEGEEHERGGAAQMAFAAAVAQIAVIDAVFSIDSIITAVGMTDVLPVMITAVVIAIGVMLLAAKTVGEFIQKHPTTKMLALSFLLLIGVALIADGLGFHIPRGYIYFAIAFSLLVEVFNILYRRARTKDRLEKAGHGEG